MRAIFIHGVPDTTRVWKGVLEHLPGIDATALGLPGFDTAVPSGFTSSKEGYVGWVIEQLEKQDSPVHLVGHDWGCLLTARVASLRPDLVRTWAGGDGPVSKEYVWHPLAKIFQTPGAGEEWMATLDLDEMSHQLAALGVPDDAAADVPRHMNETMKDCILSLYRSAVHVGEEWQPGLANITSPGMVFWGAQDDTCPVEFAHQLTRDTKASRVITFECGHWVPLQRPADLARALHEHWTAAETGEP